MASGMVHRAMVYLGLADDDYDEYEAYEEPQPVGAGRQQRVSYAPDPVDMGGTPGIRTIPRDSDQSGGSVTVTPRAAGVVRPFTPVQNAKVHVVAPGKFADAQEIGDRYKAGQPVIVNLQVADRELMRRMIDFCSGVAYALSGKMERVADKVFLVTPSNVKVSAEERQRLQENGLLRP